MYRKLIAVAAFIAVLAIVLTGCAAGVNHPSIGQQSNQASQSRAQAYAKAAALYPQPLMKNFPLRKALVDLTARQDEVNHPWYIYVQAQATGEVIGYYVAKTAPQSVCNTLSNTEAVVSDPNSDNGSLVLTSPSLNGYYAGGAGASGTCSTFFFEDQTTNAVVELNGDAFFTTDQPLALKVPAFRVKSSK